MVVSSENENEVQARLLSHLRDAGLPEEAAQEISRGAVDAWVEVVTPPPPAPGVLRAIVMRRRWVIRDEDLDLLDFGGKTMVGLAQAGFLGALTVAAAGVGAGLAAVAAQVFLLERRVRNKGVVLDRDSFAVLIALKSAEMPLSATEVARRLGHEGLRGAIADVSPKRIEEILNQLTKVVVNDGSTKAFVVQDGGLWRIAGV